MAILFQDRLERSKFFQGSSKPAPRGASGPLFVVSCKIGGVQNLSVAWLTAIFINAFMAVLIFFLSGTLRDRPSEMYAMRLLLFFFEGRTNFRRGRSYER